MSYEGPDRRRAQEPYEGAERRLDLQARAERAHRIGEWLLDRAGIIAGAVFVIYLALAVISVAVVSTNRRAKDQLEKVEEISTANRRTLELLEGCLTPDKACAKDLSEQAKRNREAIVKAIGCVLLEPPPPAGRDEASVQACYDRYLPNGEGRPK